jgi:hypothetical protein
MTKTGKYRLKRGVLRLILSKIKYNCQQFLGHSKMYELHSKFHFKKIEFLPKIP